MNAIDPALLQRAMAPMAGAGIGAVGGALAGGPDHRLQGAMLGGGLGAGGVLAAPAIRQQLEHLLPAAAAAPVAAAAKAKPRAPRTRKPKTASDAAYEAGACAALDRLGLGMEKDAFVSALMTAGRAAMPALQTAGRALMRGAGGSAMRGLGVAAQRGGNAFAAAAPRVTKGIQAAGKVLSHPVTQVGMLGASLAGG